MCVLNSDSGLGKLVQKTNQLVDKTPAGKFAKNVHEKVYGKDFTENGGYERVFFNEYTGPQEKKRQDLMATAPDQKSEEYAQWYANNRKVLLGE